jgi:ankyrin repeat protein
MNNYLFFLLLTVFQAQTMEMNVLSEKKRGKDFNIDLPSWSIIKRAKVEKKINPPEKKVFSLVKNLKREPTMLHWAAEQGNLDLIKILMRERVTLDAQDQNGDTALHIAARRAGDSSLGTHLNQHYKRIAQLLVNYGADRETRNNSGSSAAFCCALIGVDKASRPARVQSIDKKLYNSWEIKRVEKLNLKN